MIRILIADDHNLVRQGIKALLDKNDGFETVGESSDGILTLESIKALKPDVVLMDIAMPLLNGIQILEKMKQENLTTSVVILSMHSDETLVRQALRLGAKGYLLKDSLKEELTIALLSAVNGKIYLSPSIAGVMIDGYLENRVTQMNSAELLTIREKEVLKLIAEGNTNSTIAHILKISIKTVERHRSNMLAKLNINDTAGLIQYAIKTKLIFINQLDE